MFSLNNALFNLLPNAISYAEKCVGNFLNGSSSHRSQESCFSAKNSFDNNIAAKQSISLRGGLRYQILSNNFSFDKYRELTCLNSVIDNLSYIEGNINSLIYNKLGEIGEIYSEETRLILNSNQRGLISWPAMLSMVSAINNWHTEITSKLDSFNIHARNLLAEKKEKFTQLKSKLNSYPFDEAAANSLVQELEAVKSDPSLEECIKKWDEDYLNALFKLSQHQAALHYARAQQLQREIGRQVFA